MEGRRAEAQESRERVGGLQEAGVVVLGRLCDSERPLIPLSRSSRQAWLRDGEHDPVRCVEVQSAAELHREEGSESQGTCSERRRRYMSDNGFSTTRLCTMSQVDEDEVHSRYWIILRASRDACPAPSRQHV